MSTFGDIERTFADLYEYRWAMLAGILVLTSAVLGFAYWKGVHRWMWQHRIPVAIVSTPPLIVMVWLGWSLGSPLFTNKTVEEEFPLSFTAVLPSNMEMAEVEPIMAGMARVTLTVDEEMPAMTAPAATPAPDPTEAPTSPGPRQDPTKVPTMALAGEPGATAAPQQPAGPVAVATGSFKDADSFHRGKGQATIYRGGDGALLLRLEELDVTNGPDLHVVLSPHEDPDRSDEVKLEGYLDLGNLKGNRGNQNYPIPAGVDVSIFGSVVIYCKPFAVVFSVATLEAPA